MAYANRGRIFWAAKSGKKVRPGRKKTRLAETEVGGGGGTGLLVVIVEKGPSSRYGEGNGLCIVGYLGGNSYE